MGAGEGHRLGWEVFQQDEVGFQTHLLHKVGSTLGDISKGHGRVVLEQREGEASHQRVAGVVPSTLFRTSVALAGLVDINPASVASEDITGELGGELINRELCVQFLLKFYSLLFSDLCLNQIDVGLGLGELGFHRESVEVSVRNLHDGIPVLDAQVDDLASIGRQRSEFFQGTEFVTLVQGDSPRVGAGRVGESLLEFSDTLDECRVVCEGAGDFVSVVEGELNNDSRFHRICS